MTLTERIHYLLLGNGLSLWYAVRPLRDRRERRLLRRLSLTGQGGAGVDHAVCCLFEGHTYAGGLADRLRGIISVYQQCKRLGLPFRLYFKHPFDIELFLRPAAYDWRIAGDQVCRRPGDVQVFVMRPLSDSQYTLRRQRQWMRGTFDALARSRFRQAHVYTNTYTAYGDDYSSLFTELFRPSERLQRTLDRTQAAIGGPYISVSMRFLALLGDFEDTVPTGAVLTAGQQQALIDHCIAKIEELHSRFPHHRILVNSDSQRMLEVAQTLAYTHTIPGDIIHFDRCHDVADPYNLFEKTFLDFLTIAAADRVFLVRLHPKMRMSGFPYAAAMLGGKPFITEDHTES